MANDLLVDIDNEVTLTNKFEPKPLIQLSSWGPNCLLSAFVVPSLDTQSPDSPFPLFTNSLLRVHPSIFPPNYDLIMHFFSSTAFIGTVSFFTLSFATLVEVPSLQ